MTLRLANISNELVGISQATIISGVFPSGRMCDLDYEVVGLDGLSPVQVLIFIPTENESMPQAPLTTRPKDGENPDTTGAGGPAMDPKTGISPPEAIPQDQGTYQDQNEQFSEEDVAQQAANLTGQTTDGVAPQNVLGADEDKEDSPRTSGDTPSEPEARDFKKGKKESDDFADLDKSSKR